MLLDLFLFKWLAVVPLVGSLWGCGYFTDWMDMFLCPSQSQSDGQLKSLNSSSREHFSRSGDTCLGPLTNCIWSLLAAFKLLDTHMMHPHRCFYLLIRPPQDRVAYMGCAWLTFPSYFNQFCCTCLRLTFGGVFYKIHSREITGNKRKRDGKRHATKVLGRGSWHSWLSP